MLPTHVVWLGACLPPVRPPVHPCVRGVATGVYGYLYPQKSAQLNFLLGKNDARTAIQQFYPPPKKKKKNFYAPKQISGYAHAERHACVPIGLHNVNVVVYGRRQRPLYQSLVHSSHLHHILHCTNPT